MRRAALLPLWLAAGAALAGEPAPAAPAIASPPPPQAFVQTHDPGCGTSAESAARTEWPQPQRAVHTLTVWMSTRERIASGPVEIEQVERQITVWVPVQVEPVREGEPVPTCVRPVTVELTVAPLDQANYEWNLMRGERPPATPAPTDEAPEATDTYTEPPRN